MSWSVDEVNVPGVAFKDYETETAFQIYCADWLRKQSEIEPENELYRRWHHSANEREGAKAGFTAKMMGQAKGWPDFVQPGAKLAIELKLPGRAETDEQRRWLDYFSSIGWHSEVVFYFERFKEIVQGRLKVEGKH